MAPTTAATPKTVVSGAPSNTAAKPKLTPAQHAELERKVRGQVDCDKAAYDLQWQLLEGVASQALMDAAADVLMPSHWEDIVTERAIDGLCGWPRCDNPVQRSGHAGPKLHIAVAERKVYDISSLQNFCCRKCAVASSAFEQTLSTTSLYLRKGRSDAAASPASSGSGGGSADAAAAPAAAAGGDAAPAASTPSASAPAASASAPMAPPDLAAPRAEPGAKASGVGLADVLERPSTGPKLQFGNPNTAETIEGFVPRRRPDTKRPTKPSPAAAPAS